MRTLTDSNALERDIKVPKNLSEISECDNFPAFLCLFHSLTHCPPFTYNFVVANRSQNPTLPNPLPALSDALKLAKTQPRGYRQPPHDPYFDLHNANTSLECS
jgi:hypothetical protein